MTLGTPDRVVGAVSDGTADEVIDEIGGSDGPTGPAGGVLAGTFPNPAFAVPQASQAALVAEAALARNADNLTSGTVADARIAATIARDAEVTAAVSAHAALGDPHPGYLTPAEGNAAYEPLGAAAAAQAASQPLDSDLTAIAALATTAFGRAQLTLANAAALRTSAGTVIGTDVQAFDADLAAIAALTTTAYGRSLLEAANAAALRTLAGLVIGTDVQAQDAELAALAGLTSAADKLPYFTGSGTAALTTLSAFVRTLLDDADAATALATLGAQPSDATLTALAAANWAANSIPVGTGADALAQTAFAANTFPARSSAGNIAAKTITDAGLALVDDADASAQLTTLGVSTFIKTLLDDADAATALATLGAVAKTLYDANTILAATTDDTPAALTVGASTFVGRKAAGNISAMSVAEAVALLVGTGANTLAAGDDGRFTQVTHNTQTGNYTVVLADAGKLVEMNLAGANTLTVPPNSTTAFPVGTVIAFRQYGAGQTTLTPGAGVTIRSSGAKLKTAAQYSEGTLTKRAADEWVAAGDLST